MSNISQLLRYGTLKGLFRRDRRSSWRCDILVPCLDKDAEILGRTLRAVRRFLLHPIGEIFVISPLSENLKAIANSCGAKWIDEQEFMGFSASKIFYRPQGQDRAGWLFQQLIKLNGDRLGDAEWLLILDADTLFLRPQSFEDRGRLRLQYSAEPHGDYAENLERLLPGVPLAPHSFVCHHFFLKKSWLKDLEMALEPKTSGISLDNKIVNSVDPASVSGFSEYELLGHFIRFRSDISLFEDYFRNAGMLLREYTGKWWKRILFPLFFRTASFHHYYQQGRQFVE